MRSSTASGQAPAEQRLLSPAAARWLAVGLLLLAAALRFCALDDWSLWGDELTKATWARQSLAWIYHDRLPSVEAPLSIYALHLVERVGDSEFILRYPFALCGVLAVAAVYRLGRQLFGAAAGLVAAALLAILPFHVLHSQQAGPYALFSLLSALSLSAFLCAVRNPGWLSIACWVGATVLGFYTHLFTLFILAAEVSAAVVWSVVWRRQGRRMPLARLIAGLVLILILWLPEIAPAVADVGQRATARGQPAALSPGQVLAGAAALGRDLGIAFGGVPGAALLLLGLCVLGLGMAWWARRRVALLLCLLVVVPPLFTGVFRGTANVFEPRYFIFMLPVLAGVSGLGALAVAQAATRLACRLRGVGPRFLPGLVCALIVALLGVLWAPDLQRVYRSMWQDWRGVGAYLAGHVQPGDYVIQLWLLQPYSLAWYWPSGGPEPHALFLPAYELRARSLDVAPGSQVWWIIVHQGQVDRLRVLTGDQFELVIVPWLAVLSLKAGPEGPEQALSTTAMLLDVQADLAGGDAAQYRELAEDLSGASSWGRARSYLERGDDLAAAQNWSAAASWYEQAAAIYPQWGMAYTRLGNAHRALGRVPDAVAAYRRSIEVEPGYVGAYLNLGAIEEGQGRLATALELYRAGVAADPLSAWAHSMLGQALLKQDETWAAEALSHLERAVELEPDQTRWWLDLANAYHRLGRPDKSVAAYRQVLDLDPDNEAALQALQGLEP